MHLLVIDQCPSVMVRARRTQPPVTSHRNRRSALKYGSLTTPASSNVQSSRSRVSRPPLLEGPALAAQTSAAGAGTLAGMESLLVTAAPPAVDGALGVLRVKASSKADAGSLPPVAASSRAFKLPTVSDGEAWKVYTFPE